MDLDKKKMISIAMNRLDVPGLAIDMLNEVLEPALQKVVADTSNPYDDMAVAALLPVLKVEAEKLIKEKWSDLGKEMEAE